MNIEDSAHFEYILWTRDGTIKPQIDCQTAEPEPRHAARFTMKFHRGIGASFESIEVHYCSRHLIAELAKRPVLMATVLVNMIDGKLDKAAGFPC